MWVKNLIYYKFINIAKLVITCQSWWQWKVVKKMGWKVVFFSSSTWSSAKFAKFVSIIGHITKRLKESFQFRYSRRKWGRNNKWELFWLPGDFIGKERVEKRASTSDFRNSDFSKVRLGIKIINFCSEFHKEQWEIINWKAVN